MSAGTLLRVEFDQNVYARQISGLSRRGAGENVADEEAGVGVEFRGESQVCGNRYEGEAGTARAVEAVAVSVSVPAFASVIGETDLGIGSDRLYQFGLLLEHVRQFIVDILEPLADRRVVGRIEVLGLNALGVLAESRRRSQDQEISDQTG